MIKIRIQEGKNDKLIGRVDSPAKIEGKIVFLPENTDVVLEGYYFVDKFIEKDKFIIARNIKPSITFERYDVDEQFNIVKIYCIEGTNNIAKIETLPTTRKEYFFGRFWVRDFHIYKCATLISEQHTFNQIYIEKDPIEVFTENQVNTSGVLEKAIKKYGREVLSDWIKYFEERTQKNKIINDFNQKKEIYWKIKNYYEFANKVNNQIKKLEKEIKTKEKEIEKLKDYNVVVTVNEYISITAYPDGSYAVYEIKITGSQEPVSTFDSCREYGIVSINNFDITPYKNELEEAIKNARIIEKNRKVIEKLEKDTDNLYSELTNLLSIKKEKFDEIKDLVQICIPYNKRQDEKIALDYINNI